MFKIRIVVRWWACQSGRIAFTSNGTVQTSGWIYMVLSIARDSIHSNLERSPSFCRVPMALRALFFSCLLLINQYENYRTNILVPSECIQPSSNSLVSLVFHQTKIFGVPRGGETPRDSMLHLYQLRFLVPLCSSIFCIFILRILVVGSCYLARISLEPILELLDQYAYFCKYIWWINYFLTLDLFHS